MDTMTQLCSYRRYLMNLITKKGISILLGIYTAIFGCHMLILDKLIQQYTIFNYVETLFDWNYVDFMFIVIGLFVIIGSISGNKTIFRWAVIASTTLWLFFGVTFLFSEPPNNFWSQAFFMAGLSIIISIQEA